MDLLQAWANRQEQSQQYQAKWSAVDKVCMAARQIDEQDDMNNRIEDLKTDIENQQKVQKEATTSNQQLITKLLGQLELRQAEKTAQKKLVASLQYELEHLAEEQALLKKKCDSTLEVETKRKRLEDEEATSVKQLGLEIRKIKDGWLQIIFTQIHTTKPESMYYFSFKLDADRKYIVGDCQPPLGDLDVLVEKLNSTNDLSRFVHCMRKRFKALVDK